MAQFSGLPLAGHRILDTRDLDEARNRVGAVMGPHTISLAGPAARFHARLHAAELGPIGLRYLDYGSGVVIDHEHVDPSYVLCVPLAGADTAIIGRRSTVCTTSVAAMICPDQRLILQGDGACPKLLVRLNQPHLEATLQQMIGQPTRQTLRFDAAVDLTAPAMRRWLELVDLAGTELDQADARLATHPLARRHLQPRLPQMMGTCGPC